MMSDAVVSEAAALRLRFAMRTLDERVIRVSGVDRADWVSGMVTQETKSLKDRETRYAAAVHEKGKLFGDLWVYSLGEVVFFAVHKDSADDLMAHFERHIIMEDVEVALLEGVRVLTVQGPGAAELRGEDGFLCDRLGRGGVDFLIDGEMSLAQKKAELAQKGAVEASEEAWELARLEAGVPRFGVDFGRENYVQEANITPRAVSFHKGCYVGQEVVCRLEMRGHVRRQLVVLSVEGEAPEKGAKLDGELGVVTSSAWSEALGKGVALAMVKWDVASEPEGKTLSIGGRAASIVARPVP